MYYIVLIFLMAILFWGLFCLLGNTSTWPKTWAFITLIFAGVWAYLVETWLNFTTFYMVPAWEVFTGVRVPNTYDFSTVLVMVAIIFAAIMAIRTAFISYSEEGKINIFYNIPSAK